MKTKYTSTLPVLNAQGGDHAERGEIRRKWSAPALSRFFLAFVFALSVSSVKAQCATGWSVLGKWGLKQGTIVNSMDLYQSGNRVYGKASFQGMVVPPTKGGFLSPGKFGETGTIEGSVEGTVTGDNFSIKIVWTNKTTGVYTGKFGPQGQLSGTGYEIRSPSKKVNWSSNRNMVCRQTR